MVVQVTFTAIIQNRVEEGEFTNQIQNKLFARFNIVNIWQTARHTSCHEKKVNSCPCTQTPLRLTHTTKKQQQKQLYRNQTIAPLVYATATVQWWLGTPLAQCWARFKTCHCFRHYSVTLSKIYTLELKSNFVHQRMLHCETHDGATQLNTIRQTVSTDHCFVMPRVSTGTVPSDWDLNWAVFSFMVTQQNTVLS